MRERAGLRTRRPHCARGAVMSAIRYSGALRIRITFVGKSPPEYRCHISCPSTPGQLPCRIYVHPNEAKMHAVDSPEAFDAVAKAALSFALDEHWPITEYAASDGDGWIISRSAKSSNVWL
jgi:hypothetical protein